MTSRLPEITLLFISLFVQGLPFLFLGALISGLVSSFLPIRQFISWMPKSPLASALLGILAGLVFPSCECVGLPLVRRLTMKGLPLCAALAYLFAGPAINPIALGSTWLAFSFEDPAIAVLLRFSGSVLVALILALVLNRLGATWVVRPEVISASGSNENLETAPAEAALWLRSRHPRLAAAMQITLSDFLTVSLFYIAGSLLAALAQTYAGAFLGDMGNTPSAIPLMMLAAILSSVCSSADAFVAKSYVGMSQAATFAFLWIGPVLDLKLLMVYRSFFQPRAILLLSALAILIVLLLALSLNRLPPELFSRSYWEGWN
jgi:uncharacterized membrane protein YraQ (UPF0718 family)